ncbi:MAG: rhodanese-like domain-containing protein [Chloroflexi bacterium]|nr:MAG: rhodanese-like domain-containing protein [Chloroflexota bacterium]
MSGKQSVLLAITILILFASACRAHPAQTGPTQIIEPTSTQPPAGLPLIEAEVPRVTVQEAKAALERGAAIIVDVRSAEAFDVSHIAGAINIQLGEIETDPTGLKLAKDQWIITYCT